MMLKHSLSGWALGMSVLITAAFIVGCSGEQTTKDSTPGGRASGTTKDSTPGGRASGTTKDSTPGGRASGTTKDSTPGGRASGTTKDSTPGGRASGTPGGRATKDSTPGGRASGMTKDSTPGGRASGIFSAIRGGGEGTLATFTVISSGWGHTCGLRDDGAAVCWGSQQVVIHP